MPDDTNLQPDQQGLTAAGLPLQRTCSFEVKGCNLYNCEIQRSHVRFDLIFPMAPVKIRSTI